MVLNKLGAPGIGHAGTGSAVRLGGRESAASETPVRDAVDLRGKQDPEMVDLRKKVSFLPLFPAAPKKNIKLLQHLKAFELPTPTTSGARNDTPVVIVHGTLADEKSVDEIRKYFLAAGHGTQLDSYASITDGQHLSTSGQLLSTRINHARLHMLELHLKELGPLRTDPAKLMGRLGMSADLYGRHDASVEKIGALLPGLLDSLERMAALGESELSETLGRRTMQIEKDLAASVARTGFASDVADAKLRGELCGKVAAEIMDSIAPRAAVVGHSMGGFVAYTLAMNPKTDMADKSEFSYDAGSGVATVITLSSPIKSGVNRPLPPALTNRYDDLLQRYFLNAMENTPGMGLAMMNPFFAAWYEATRAGQRVASGAWSDLGTAVVSPIIYAMKPGVEEISEGSEFIHKYVENKKIPYGMTVVAMTSDEDGVSLADHSTVDDRQPNGQNVDSYVTVEPKDLDEDPLRTPSIAAHRKMATHPFKSAEEYREQIQENPRQIGRALDRSNYDGGRWKTLQVLLEDLKANPALFESPEMRPVLDSIRKVAEERLPFNDSPSFVAKQILTLASCYKK